MAIYTRYEIPDISHEPPRDSLFLERRNDDEVFCSIGTENSEDMSMMVLVDAEDLKMVFEQLFARDK